MPVTSYKQDYLWSRKGEFYILREMENKSLRILSKLFKVNRETVSRFIHSQRYQEFLFLLEGDRIMNEILKCWSKWEIDTIYDLNRETEEEIKKELRKKYPKLF